MSDETLYQAATELKKAWHEAVVDPIMSIAVSILTPMVGFIARLLERGGHE